MLRLLCALSLFGITTTFLSADEFTPAPDTQNKDDHPPTPQESLKKITVPEGFNVTLFAAEPDVRQPIDMKFDSRGRLWVAEFYAYNGKDFDDDVRDRILILEDTDRDGQHDTVKVFWDKGHILTSFEFGTDGIYVLNDGELQFVSDKDHDDKADGEPRTLMNGFDTKQIGHNIVSGLLWGPDGWIYGRHGIKATSYPAAPHVPMDQRVPMNTGIWRYHPVKELFEPVVHGTTNPWGLDYNEDGEFFFTNNVIGHMWHVIPGTHYKRMYGQDFNPHLYELMDQHADHYHWDNSQKWTDSREGVGVHGELGGGHSHCGGMIYLGDNFPDEYRGRMFMCNTHGRRINQDIIDREGSGYVIKHGPDFMFANQPWFRGVCLTYGPDGAVYVSDWCDFGECHDHDGIHRSSGRIYRISYGDPQPVPKDFDLAKLKPEELVNLLEHKNHWYRRTARRELWSMFQRLRSGEKQTHNLREVLIRLVNDANEPGSSDRSLECYRTLQTLGNENGGSLLNHPSERHRALGLRWLSEQSGNDSVKLESRLLDMAVFPEANEKHPSSLVRLTLASAAQKFPEVVRWSILHQLAVARDNSQTGETSIDPEDHNLPLMIWYGLEPLVPQHPEEAMEIVAKTNLPQLQRFISRRLTSEITEHTKPVEQLVELLEHADTQHRQEQILIGMSEALRGWRKAAPPSNWSEVALKLSKSDNENIRKLSQELSLVFGDGRAMDDLRKLANDKQVEAETRQRAILLLASAEIDDLQPFLLKLLPDRDVTLAVLQALVHCDDPAAAKQIVNRYNSFNAEWKPVAIQTLTSRVSFADQLLDAIDTQKIEAGEISAAQAREIQNLGDEKLNQKLSKIWGTLRQTPAEKKKLIARYKLLLEAPSPHEQDVEQGHKLFKETCANCHRLFGEGAQVAPDLTGSNRDNLDYLLMNILDPSGVVPQAFKVSVIVLEDGRVLTGVIGRDDGQTVDIQTAKEKVTIPKSDIDIVKPSDLSLMPDGLFEKLTKDEIRNLIGYLQSRRRPTP